MAKLEPGVKVGYLTILDNIGYKYYSKGRVIIYKCKCDCGREINVVATTLYSALNKNYKPSCGCNTDQVRQISRKNPLKTSRSGIKGVFVFQGKWYATIHYNGRTKNVLAKNREDAIMKRKLLEEKYFDPILDDFNDKIKKKDYEEKN